jgi:hypothetical protein
MPDTHPTAAELPASPCGRAGQWLTCLMDEQEACAFPLAHLSRYYCPGENELQLRFPIHTLTILLADHSAEPLLKQILSGEVSILAASTYPANGTFDGQTPRRVKRLFLDPAETLDAGEQLEPPLPGNP